MIDLHSHILPGVDDGAKSIDESVLMARTAVESGTTVLACTPHIKPPIYMNDSASISAAIRELRSVLANEDIPLELVIGADIHVRPDLMDGLDKGILPTLNESRYFLFEPSHNVMPPKLVSFCRAILAGGFTPVLTHPERLTWIEQHYSTICDLDELGVAIQLTAGSILGLFGDRAEYWSHKMLEENRVDIVASDAHNSRHRTTALSDVREWLIETYGHEHAMLLLHRNPLRILRDEDLLPRKPRTEIIVEKVWGIRKMVDRLMGN